ncbi:MAG: hypothetical protein ACI9WC_000581 [Arenicella sp.]|jgi:hypothetical protein
MSPDNLLIIAMIVFALMFVGIVLTVLEFKKGAPQEQEEQEARKSKL